MIAEAGNRLLTRGRNLLDMRAIFTRNTYLIVILKTHAPKPDIYPSFTYLSLRWRHYNIYLRYGTISPCDKDPQDFRRQGHQLALGHTTISISCFYLTTSDGKAFWLRKWFITLHPAPCRLQLIFMSVKTRLKVCSGCQFKA